MPTILVVRSPDIGTVCDRESLWISVCFQVSLRKLPGFEQDRIPEDRIPEDGLSQRVLG